MLGSSFRLLLRSVASVVFAALLIALSGDVADAQAGRDKSSGSRGPQTQNAPLPQAAIAPTHTERRIALVIGVDRYEHLPRLEKAVADARAVAKVLREDLGFSTVLTEENADRRAISRKLAELDVAIQPGDTVFFFFSGHGVALGADNVLLPADMPKPGHGQDGIVRDDGFAVDGIVRRIQGRGAKVALLVLDACRDNPFEQVGTRSIGATRGLTRIDAPTGVFVLFSAGLGQKALDRLPGSDPVATSVFTRHLIPALQTPGLSHVQIAKRVQQEVDALTKRVAHAQQPAYYDQIVGDVVLKAGIALMAPQAPVENRQPTPPIPPAPRDRALSVEPGSGQVFRDTLANGHPCAFCPQMVVMPAGTFFMGSSNQDVTALIKRFGSIPAERARETRSELPRQRIAIGNSFAVGKFEVTFDEWDACAAAKGCRAEDDAPHGRGRQPVVNMSWHDVKSYVLWLSRATGHSYRLLTEAEWEYSARAGTDTQFHFGDAITSAHASFNKDYGPTDVVGSYPPNAWGLHDVHGNVFEWVEDCWHPTYVGRPTDGSAWIKGCPDSSTRVLRGGSHASGYVVSRSAFRSRREASDIDNAQIFGFRVARDIRK